MGLGVRDTASVARQTNTWLVLVFSWNFLTVTEIWNISSQVLKVPVFVSGVRLTVYSSLGTVQRLAQSTTVLEYSLTEL